MGAMKIRKSDSFDVTVSDDGVITLYRRMATSFGERHGGAATLTLLMTVVQMVAVLGATILAVWLGGTTYSINTKASILVGFVGLAVLVDLVLAVLYVRVRYLLIGLAIIAGVLGIGAVAYWLLWHLVS